MAPPTVYATPAQQLSRVLAQAREEGLSFDEAWDRAMNVGGRTVLVTDPNPPAGAVRWPTDGAERVAWREAIVSMREVWRRAYEREEATPGERVLLELAVRLGIVPSREPAAA